MAVTRVAALWARAQSLLETQTVQTWPIEGADTGVTSDTGRLHVTPGDAASRDSEE